MSLFKWIKPFKKGHSFRISLYLDKCAGIIISRVLFEVRENMVITWSFGRAFFTTMIDLVKSRMNIIDVQQLKVVFSSRHHYYITADYKKYAFKIQKHFWPKKLLLKFCLQLQFVSISISNNLFVTPKKRKHQFTNSRIYSDVKCLLKPLKWKRRL